MEQVVAAWVAEFGYDQRVVFLAQRLGALFVSLLDGDDLHCGEPFRTDLLSRSKDMGALVF